MAPKKPTRKFSLKRHTSEKPGDETMSISTAMSVRASHTDINKTNYLETMIHLLKAYIGAGIFAMGKAVQHAGLIFGYFMIIFLGLICTYNSHVLTGCAKHVKNILNLEELPNYPETVEFSFLLGPPTFSKRTKLIKSLVKWYIISTQLGFCSIYLLFISSTVDQMAKQYNLFTIELHLLILLVGIIVLFTTLIRTIKYLTPLSFIADILIFSGLIGTIYLCSADGYPAIATRPAISNWDEWPIFLSMTIFSFEGIAVILPLHNEMQNPDLFSSTFGIINVGMFIIVFANACLGFLSYLKFGDNIKDIVIINFGDGIAPNIIKLSVITAIILTYAIQFHVAIDVSWWDIVAKTRFKHLIIMEIMYRLCLSMITIIMAVIVPYLALFVALIGAVFSTSLALIFPALCDILLRSNPNVEKKLQSKNKHAQRIRFLMDGVTLIISLMAFLTGTITSLFQLYLAFKESLTIE